MIGSLLRSSSGTPFGPVGGGGRPPQGPACPPQGSVCPTPKNYVKNICIVHVLKLMIITTKNTEVKMKIKCMKFDAKKGGLAVDVI